jgi:hypothetical protein
VLFLKEKIQKHLKGVRKGLERGQEVTGIPLTIRIFLAGDKFLKSLPKLP